MKKRSGRNNLKKEKAVMVASTVLVLSALTVTGIYVRNGKEKEQDGGYTIDFSALEEEQPYGSIAEEIPVTDSDLDYDPASTEAGSSTVESTYGVTADAGAAADNGKTADNGQTTDKTETEAEAEKIKEASSDLVVDEARTKDGLDETAKALPAPAAEFTEEEADETSSDAVAAQIQPELAFNEADGLVMPFAGNILIDYSADKSVYFPTLQQYKCNPALVISAVAGDSVKAAADGMVSRIYDDAVTGKTVVMNLGNGYELTYGQLQNITVSEGAYVPEGEIFAEMAEPTRYFSKEGCNLYLKLTKDGVPVDPGV